MEKNVLRNPICLLITALAILTFSSCGNGGGGTSTQAGGGSDTATLSWDVPTTNADGTSLNDLAGYKIYYGISSGNYGLPIDKPLGSDGLSCLVFTNPDRTECTYTVTGLNSGTKYWFAVTAYDTSGKESDYSNEDSKAIQ